ncbi:MAG: SusC/RagA family TonB-linked outer membrane protein [Prevotellaceae bacterium]|jgi:TonB-linked SusC/RagA family outer membrane protein|nr:SusC/RagA family TonB-linked outer membrane protein [Prevotellaceae bacterium]
MNKSYSKLGISCAGLQEYLKFLFVLATIFVPWALSAQQTVTGVVKDAETEDPVPGVAVLIKGTNVGGVTDENGNFSIQASENNVIVFKLLGYKTQEHTATKTTAVLTILFELDAVSLENVVVEAGIIRRDRLGFTGAYSTISKEDLKSVGNTNLIQSLKSLDPAFVIVENNLAGSNPNVLANIEVRGQTSMNITSVQDAAAVANNLPLFILDGFEASLQEINDLDINRVESITILKDAGSTAIYGSKGANGVIVVETIKPVAGKIFISYNGDFQLATPDLSVYNMMNAAEKLEFERLAGRYDYNENADFDVSIPTLGINPTGEGQKQYYERLALIRSGVDTYWLSEPVRNAFTQQHSVTVAGGEKALQFNAGLNYKNNPGVMKGVNRDTYGGNIKLIYRGVKGLSVQNNIFISGTNSENGPWGSFSDFANANPYYKKRNADGTIPKYLDEEGNTVAANPLYNATLNSRHSEDILNITNNTAIDWSINRDLLLRGSISIKKSSTNSVDFTDPSHSSFDNTTYDKKGTYESNLNSYWMYNANISINYFKSLKQHNFTLIGRANIENANTVNEGFTAVGFPEGSVGYPSYAFSYKPDSRPSYSEKMTRNVGFIGAFNYNYKYRYLFDVNYNLDGSTNFGRNKRFQSFWSAGIGWNLQREAFAADWDWLNEFKIRGTYGTNGNQNVNVVTNSVYSYYVGNDIFGQAAYLSQTGNPNLNWQVVEKTGAGIDVSLLDEKLRFNFDVYKNVTDPQIVSLAQRPSTGVSNYSFNLGNLTTKGYEFKIYYNVASNAANNFLLNLRATAGHSKGVYGGFEESLNSLNEAYGSLGETNLTSLQHYEDGHSPADIWAVQSLGIDPATGREIFLKKNGEQTYIYDPDDRIAIANTRPDIEGIVGFTVRYKKITLNANFRYYVGASRYNEALFNKVENITSSQIVYNQDKRALYDRWQKAGDIAEFKGISLYAANATPVSSRFIQKDNYFRGESAKLTWNFTGEKWLKSVKLQDLSLSLSMSDFFNIYSIKIERGINSPFQRVFVMNLSARF